MGSRTCPNCGERNPRYRGSCYRCNAALSRRERERRRDQHKVNELREANGKEPLYDVPEVEEVEPVEGGGGVGFGLFLVLVAAVALVSYLVYVGLL